MAFTVGMTGTAQVDTEITEELISEFIVAYTQSNTTEDLVEFRRDINAKSIAFPRFAALADATTPLVEDVDPDSVAMSDTEILLTPVEYGNVITTTSLADLQSGGRTSRAAMQLIGTNMSNTNDALAIAALEASTNVRFAQGEAAVTDLTAAHIMSATELDYVYNKLSRANVPVHPATGTYVALMHDDVIHDLRTASAAGTWLDVSKYGQSEMVLKNEVGMYKGFRIVRNNRCAIGVDAGATTVDSYTSSFLGFNGLGKAQSQMNEIRVTGPFDKLGRFLNLGWYAVQKYQIIESDAVYKVVSASSVGANT